jgi:hypothetical protein
VQAGLLGRPPAALAGDDLEAAPRAIGPGDDRLQQTLLADRIRQVEQLESSRLRGLWPLGCSWSWTAAARRGRKPRVGLGRLPMAE